VGLLDYYKQFQGLSEEEVNAELRRKSLERRERELARVDPIDLSQTTWPELPPPDVVNAVTYVARRGLHRYLDPQAGELRGELAEHHGVAPGQVAVGNGAAQLLSAAAQALLEPGDELVTPWPSYPLLPLIARRARASAVPVPGFGAEAVLRAVNERTRIVAICNPNDPTGAIFSRDELDGLLDGLPERVVVLLDEALAEYAGEDAVPLLEHRPRLLVFRTFSKAWGLAGLRCGYALGGPESGPLLEGLVPELGINELAQAGVLEALRHTKGIVARRVATVTEERERLVAELRARGYDVPDSRANVVWIGRDGVDGAELAARAERHKVIVAGGARFGDPGRVRAAVQSRPAGDRLLRAFEL
jgi:histidinol-phosphate aminotransferase